MRAALAIAGLDPSGGAGIAADLRAFGAAGVWGGAVCAAITVQSTRGVAEVHAVASRLVTAQALEILSDVTFGAIKTGALGSTQNVRAMLRIADRHAHIPWIVDPVMVPSRHRAKARLDGDGRGSIVALRELSLRATLLTPNVDEASALLGKRIVTLEDARDAAELFVRGGARAVLLKGGHLRASPMAIDWFASRDGVTRLARARRRTPPLHGTGCTLASLIAGHLARRKSRKLPNDDELVAAIRWARARLDVALRHPLRVGHGLRVLPLVRRV